MATILEQEVMDEVARLGSADILVGIPSFRNADTIAHVVDAVGKGLVEYFPGLRPVIVNSDGGSNDRTRDVVMATPVPHTVEKIVTPYRGIAGKGSAFHTIFEIAARLGSKVVIVVDSDLRSITPEWIRDLGEPVWKMNYGFVTPHYLRYKYDGTITNSLAYPLTRALYGRRLRQPIGGDFGFTGALSQIYSHRDVWKTDIARFGIDIWMTTLAINEGFRVCESCMGIKLHNVKDPGSDLGSMFCEVTGTMFRLMKEYEVKWMVSRGSAPVRTFGVECTAEPEALEASYENLIDHFHIGYDEYKDQWREILREENYERVEHAYSMSDEEFDFTLGLWARIVYDFAIEYNFGEGAQGEVVDALVPLYCGRTASFVKDTSNLSTIEAEVEVERTAETFEALKDYLISHWCQRREEALGESGPCEDRGP